MRDTENKHTKLTSPVERSRIIQYLQKLFLPAATKLTIGSEMLHWINRSSYVIFAALLIKIDTLVHMLISLSCPEHSSERHGKNCSGLDPNRFSTGAVGRWVSFFNPIKAMLASWEVIFLNVFLSIQHNNAQNMFSILLTAGCTLISLPFFITLYMPM